MVKKVALGKGIASLIQEAPNDLLRKSLNDSELSDSAILNQPMLIDVESIKTNSGQPRKIFKEKELRELSNSIKENGVIQPIIISKSEEGYDLIAGERRLRASIDAGLDKIPAIIKRATEREKIVMSIIENVQRSDLNCVEEALAYYKLMNDYNLTQEEVAKKLGKERSTIANYLRILKLPRPIIDLLQKEELSFGHAKVLASCSDRESMITLARKTVAENLSVRELEKQIKMAAKMPAINEKKKKIQDENLRQLQDKLEQRTGFNLSVKSTRNGRGHVALNFSNEAEFNDIYDFLINK